MAPTLLFDAYSLVYRAFFALPPMSTVRGTPTSALYGFSTLILKMLRETGAHAAAVALDGPQATFRHQAFAAYKKSRSAAPTPLGHQLRLLPELLDAWGFPAFLVPGFEADDVVATLARELREAGEEPLIVTGDLDALECVGGSTRVFAVGRGTEGRIYDEAAVWARFGVGPTELPDWKALAGDPSDDIPGVPGVGSKRASALVRTFGGIEGLLRRVSEVTPKKVRAAIETHREDLPLWRDLARVRDDVPLPPGPRAAPLDDEHAAAVEALFDRLEFRSLIPRLRMLQNTRP